MIDLEKPLRDGIPQAFLDNVLDAVPLQDIQDDMVDFGDISELTDRELEELIEDIDDDSVLGGSDVSASGHGPLLKWWDQVDERGNPLPPEFERDDKILSIIMSPYYLVKYVMLAVERKRITPRNDMIPFMRSVSKVFLITFVLSLLLMLNGYNFIVNTLYLTVVSAVITLGSFVYVKKNEILDGGLDYEYDDIDLSHLDADELEAYFKGELELDDFGDVEDLDDLGYDESYDEIMGNVPKSSVENESSNFVLEMIKAKREYNDKLPLKENVIPMNLTLDEFNERLIDGFKASAKYRDKNLVDREDIVLSMNEYILCNNPGFSEERLIDPGTHVYNNINFLLYQGLMNIFNQLDFSGNHTMQVQAVTENDLFYKVVVELPKFVKVHRITSDIRYLESQFKMHENDNEVKIKVSMYKDYIVFRLDKFKKLVVTFGDAIRYHNPETGDRTYYEFVDEDEFDLPFLVGLQNDEFPVVFEFADEPNMFVAGGTGSGKSWAVFEFIFNMVFQAHPGDVNFLILDYKQDIQYEVMGNLPHVVDVKNQNENPEEYIEYLREVKLELDRRKDVLNSLGFSKWSELRKHFKEKGDIEKMREFPWLFVILEETAALTSSLETQDKSLRDEYVLLAKEIAKQCRAYGIKLVMISQRTTNDDLPKPVSSECTTRLGFRLAEADLERVDLLPKGEQPPGSVGFAMFRKLGLTHAIPIKSLGVGGMNDGQIQNLTRMMAIEWQLRISDEDVDDKRKYPKFKLLGNRQEIRKRVLADYESEDYFGEKRKQAALDKVLGLDEGVDDSEDTREPESLGEVKLNVPKKPNKSGSSTRVGKSSRAGKAERQSTYPKRSNTKSESMSQEERMANYRKAKARLSEQKRKEPSELQKNAVRARPTKRVSNRTDAGVGKGTPENKMANKPRVGDPSNDANNRNQDKSKKSKGSGEWKPMMGYKPKK